MSRSGSKDAGTTDAGWAGAPGGLDTLPKLLRHNAKRRADQIALREKELGIWQSITWKEYYQRVRDFALGLKSLGIESGDKIAILGDNRPEWVIAELAAQSLGAISMGVYQDSVAEEVQFLVGFSDAKVVVAEDQEQVDKVLEVKERLPKVEHVVYYDPKGLRNYTEDSLLHFPDVEKLGSEADGSELDALIDATQADDVAILSTTSGTTGKPKLAMLTHWNLISMAHNLQQVDPMSADDDFVSFLPMAWIGEQMISIACGLSVGFPVCFPEEPETVQENIREIGPRMMFSPPRIWENMVSEVQVKIEDTSWLKRKVFERAIEVGRSAAAARQRREKLGGMLQIKSFLASACCFFWLKDKLGLRRIRRAYTGGAALGPDIFSFFHALGVNLKQIYGQTEVSGISAVHRDGDIKPQTVGTPLPETEVRIGDGGEILTKGPAVFVGYYKGAEATAETLKDGWLHSGDAGYFDDDGHLIVIDRKDDVMTLHDGTQFSPQFIENKLKFCAYVREAVVFGGGDHESVTSLITIDFANTGKWAEKRQIPYTTFTDLSQKGPVYELIRDYVVTTNEDLPKAARIRRFLLLHKELDADDAELTRTRKIRRKVIAERYEALVEALYGDDGEVTIESEISYQDGTTAQIETALRIETLGIETIRGGD